MGECSKSAAGSQRDSQTLYNSSFKKNVNSKSNKLVPVEVVPSPAESASTEVSDIVDLAELERVGGVLSPSTDFDNIQSPLETRKYVEENGVLINKGDKTPHALRKRPTMFYR